MNFAECANCLLHGWKPEEGQRSLQQCSKCKLIQYCSKECQAEHWKRVHQKQCRYFADPVKAQKFGHKDEDCALCLEVARVGKDEICQATNPNYECIMKEMFPSGMYHPHPFPVTGQPGNAYEKAVIVLWQLLKKLELTQPGVITSCRGKFVKVVAELKAIRLEIWKVRKITQISYRSDLSKATTSLEELLDTIRGKVGSDQFMDNLVQIIGLVDHMLIELVMSEKLQSLLNPVVDMPDDLHTIVSQALNNSTNFLAMANQVIDALATQVVPYKDLLRIVCGGSLEKRCNFCQENTTIASIEPNPGGIPFVFFKFEITEIYCCGTPNCLTKIIPIQQNYPRILTAVFITVKERESTRCDFCSKLPPRGGGHHCSKCLTVMYCSVNCLDQDREIHKEFCREEVEERKKKFGGSGRRMEARDIVDRVEKVFEKMALENVELSKEIQKGSEVVSKFKLKDASKKAKK